MTARPIFPDNRRRSFCAAVALMLVMVAVEATGYTSQVFNNQTPSLPDGKFVFLQHRINVTTVTIAGYCHLFNPSCPGIRSPYIFEEKTGVFTISDYQDQDEPINDSLILFYGREYSSDWNWCANGNSGLFVYSLPRQYGNISFESVTGDGTAKIHYDNIPIVLKPGEQWENSARRIQSMGPVLTETVATPEPKIGSTVFINEVPMNCTQEIATTQSIYNAGVFDNTAIIVQKQGRI